jgi:hypothetical protein
MFVIIGLSFANPKIAEKINRKLIKFFFIIYKYILRLIKCQMCLLDLLFYLQEFLFLNNI